MAKGRKTGGRRTKLTPETHQKIVSAIRAGNYCTVAARYAGIPEGTFFRWMQRGRHEDSGIYREFHDAVKDGESAAEIRAVATVQKHMEGNWQAAMTFLERKFPNRWGRRDRLKLEVEPQEALAALLGIDPSAIGTAVDAALDDFDVDEE